MNVSQYNCSAQASKSTSLTKTNGFINQQYIYCHKRGAKRRGGRRPIDAGEKILGGVLFFGGGGCWGVLFSRGGVGGFLGGWGRFKE